MQTRLGYTTHMPKQCKLSDSWCHHPRVWKQPWFYFAFSLQNCPFSCSPLWSSILDWRVGIIFSIGREMFVFFCNRYCWFCNPTGYWEPPRNYSKYKIQTFTLHIALTVLQHLSSSCIRKRKPYYPAVRYLFAFNPKIWDV